MFTLFKNKKESHFHVKCASFGGDSTVMWCGRIEKKMQCMILSTCSFTKNVCKHCVESYRSTIYGLNGINICYEDLRVRNARFWVDIIKNNKESRLPKSLSFKNSKEYKNIIFKEFLKNIRKNRFWQ